MHTKRNAALAAVLAGAAIAGSAVAATGSAAAAASHTSKASQQHSAAQLKQAIKTRQKASHNTGVSGSGPWSQADYKPRPGDWRPYVLAPSSHEVKPTSIVDADPRGGQIQGDPQAALNGKGSVTLVSSGDRTTSPLLIIDFGKEVAGQVQVHVQSTSSTQPQLHACFSESLQYAALSPGENDGETAYAPGCDTANIWNGYPGQPYTWDSDSHTLPLAGATLPATITDPTIRGGFRYLTLFLDGPGTVTINGVALKFTAAPLQKDPAAYKGWFESSDNTLNKIWYAGAYTTQIDTTMSNTAKSWPYSTGEADSADSQIPGANPNQEVILDGGKRDRDVWQGDLGVEAPVTFLTSDDVGAVDNSLSALASQQLPDGYVPAEGLVGAHNTGEETTYGEYVTWFVNNLAVDYLYTGNLSYLKRYYPQLQKAMAWLESVRQQDPQGLISFASSGSCGTYAYSDCDHLTYINALYYRNLQQMVTLAKAVGDPASAKTYAATAADVKQAINSQLWNASAGAYQVSRENASVFPEDANAMAILAGIASPAQAQSALAYLRANNWSTYGSLTVASTSSPIPQEYEPLPMGFEVQARLSGDDADELSYDTALQLMRKYWGWQLTQDPQSTFWEKTNTAGQPAIGQFTSLAHGWATTPTIALTTQVLGIAPATAGYKTWTLTPHPASLAWAQGAVPTPHGQLSASWKHSGSRFTEQVKAPAHTTGTLAIPTFGGTMRITVDGRLVWNGTKSPTGNASADGSFVDVSGVGPGSHTVVASAVKKPAATAQLTVQPTSLTGSPDAVDAVHVTLAAVAPGTVSGTLSASQPTGFTVEPAQRKIDLASDGRTVSKNLTFYVAMPDGAVTGTPDIHFAFKGSGGLSASGDTTVQGSAQNVLYGFEDGTTQGWSAGQNVGSVAAVTSFADGPGTPFDGSYALDAGCDPVSASDPHEVDITPAAPIDLSGAKTFSLEEDAYGGVPGGTGYETTVTLTGSGGQTLTSTQQINPNAWNPISIDVSAWPYRDAVSKVAVSFQAEGSTYGWGCHFQIDDVGWSA